jgi:flavorubredoxin
MKKRSKRKGLKVILTVVIVLIVLIVAAVAGGMILMKYDYGDRTEILVSSLPSPDRALVVYQPSLTAASHDVAYAIARGLNDFGYAVTVTNPGRHLPADITAYSIVVLGSPNYGSSVADALTEYVSKIDDFSGKRVILYSTSGAVTVMPELEKLRLLLHGEEPYAMVKFQFRESEKNEAEAYQLGLNAAQQ